MIGCIGYDFAHWLLAWVVQVWPLILFWYAWVLSDRAWQTYLAGNPHVLILNTPALTWLSPIAALSGPALVMAALIAFHRIGPGSRILALVGVTGFAAPPRS